MMRPAWQVSGLIFFLVLCFAAAALGGMATYPRIENWYAELNKPAGTPPDWLFGPVWTFLYATMAVAAWLVWRREGRIETRRPLALFAVQLALNVAWSWLFFGLQSPGLALIDIALLLVAIAATLAVFWRATPAAGWLLVPYLLWVGFASWLNFAIWRLNA